MMTGQPHTELPLTTDPERWCHDLWFDSRQAAWVEQTPDVKTASHHDSNAITFHRVCNFRSLVNRGFKDYLTE